MILGATVITNADASGCNLIIENKVPILREKDILSENEANSPCRRIYFVIQLMYIDEENRNTHQKTYWKLVKDLVIAVPSTVALVDQISEKIVSGQYYQALKLAQKLRDYEREVLSRAQ